MPSKAIVAAAGEQVVEQGLGVHGSGSLVVDGGTEGLRLSRIGSRSGSAMPSWLQMSRASRQSPKRSSRSPRRACSRLQRFQGQVGLDTEQRRAPPRGRRRRRRRPAPLPRPADSDACRRSCARPAHGRGESNSSTPCEVSITSGPDIAEPPDLAHHDVVGTARDDAHAAEAAVGAADQHDHRECRRRARRAARASPRTRRSGRRWPRAGARRRTRPAAARRAGRSRSARCSRPTSLAPCTSPTPPPMKAPSCAATKHRACRRACARPIATPSSNAAGHAELAQVRAAHPLGRRQPSRESCRRREDRGQALARTGPRRSCASWLGFR